MFIQKFKTNGVITISSIEDGRKAMIAEPFKFDTFASDDENGMFVTLQSWDEDTEHLDLSRLIGKKIKITIEVFD